MVKAHRIVEDQAKLTSYRATQDIEKAVQLEMLFDFTKPKMPFSGWHDLIATPFRYELPVGIEHKARFRPPFFSKNVFYSSAYLETALYEYSYHFMRQRAHLQIGKRKIMPETGTRTGFSVDADSEKAVRIATQQNSASIMNKNDYSASHQFVEKNLNINFIIYPSVRDPKHRDNFAIMDISLLSKDINSERQLKFFYDYKKKILTWLNLPLEISWKKFNK